MAIRHTDDGAPTRLEDAGHLRHRALGGIEVFDRAHRIDRIKTIVLEGNVPHIAGDTLQGPGVRLAREGGACLPDGGFGDVDAEGTRTLLGGPQENAGVLGLIPQVGFENRQPLKRREMLGEEPFFILRVVARGRGAAEVGKTLANSFPEVLVFACSGGQGCSLLTVQLQVLSANESARVSPLVTRPVVIVGP